MGQVDLTSWRAWRLRRTRWLNDTYGLGGLDNSNRSVKPENPHLPSRPGDQDVSD